MTDRILAPVWVLALMLTASAQAGDWTLKQPANSPPARSGHAMAYDAARRQVVLFGGVGANGYLSDTWMWDGANWTQKFPANSPSARTEHAMAYDHVSRQVVLFGGSSPGLTLAVEALVNSDTWVWDGSNWTQVLPLIGGRFNHAMAYDAADGQVLMYGGSDSFFGIGDSDLMDTLVWDGSSWGGTVPAKNPGPRDGFTLAYDSINSQVILFGGKPVPYSLIPLGDTWAWDGSNWAQKSPADSPPARILHSMASEPIHGQILLFGGVDSSSRPFADTWIWDGLNWSQQSPTQNPPARSQAGMTFSATGQMVLFGGLGASGALSDTWVWTQSADAQMLAPSPGSTLLSNAAVFSWTLATGADNYQLDIGNSLGATGLFSTVTVATSQSVSGLPCDGGTLYVQLSTHLNGVWQPPQQYTYSAANCGSPAVLHITKTHTGNFARGQTYGLYNVTVSNPTGAGTATGVVTVTEGLPSGLTLAAMNGAGWACTNNTCTRSDALGAGSSYFPITVAVSVGTEASSPALNTVSLSSGGSVVANASDSTAITAQVLSVSPQVLNFGYNGSLITGQQTVTVTFSGGPALSWGAMSDQPNIHLAITPFPAIGNGAIRVVASPGPSGMITLASPGTVGSPIQIPVNITSVPIAPPFGSFDTPVNNVSGVSGAIAVTGWALDNIGRVNLVDIWREPVGSEPTQPNDLVYIGDAVPVCGARPDVQSAFPTNPFNNCAGWGYLLLTNVLPNGTYRLHAIAHNQDGATTDLGTKSISVDNAHATKPFGTLDTPSPGGTVSGNDFLNFGWALTPQPAMIPIDGSTITVMVDGVALGHPVYNQFGSDIASAFPGLANSLGAVGYFSFAPTTLTNGTHTIDWVVYDNQGHGDGIGSRFFTVHNNVIPNSAAPEEEIAQPAGGVLRLRRGFDLAREPALLRADSKGVHTVEIAELDHMELQVGATSGYLLVNGEHRQLPIGSTLKGGTFYWQAGPGFLGVYPLVFERPDGSLVEVRVVIRPKTY